MWLEELTAQSQYVQSNLKWNNILALSLELLLQVVSLADTYLTLYLQVNIRTLFCNKYIHIQIDKCLRIFSAFCIVGVSIDYVDKREKKKL